MDPTKFKNGGHKPSHFICQVKRAMKKDARVMQIAAACSENYSGPFSDAFFGLGVAEWCDFSVLVAFQRPPVFRSDSTKKRYC